MVRNGKFEFYKDKAGNYNFRLKAGNGVVLCEGQSLFTKEFVLNNIEKVKKIAVDAEVIYIHE